MKRSKTAIDISKRQFTKRVGLGLAAIPVLAIAGRTQAADPALVDPESDLAKSLQYVTTSDVDGQNCANCSFYAGTADSTSAACPIFQGSAVAAEARCSAWSAKG